MSLGQRVERDWWITVALAPLMTFSTGVVNRRAAKRAGLIHVKAVPLEMQFIDLVPTAVPRSHPIAGRGGFEGRRLDI